MPTISPPATAEPAKAVAAPPPKETPATEVKPPIASNGDGKSHESEAMRELEGFDDKPERKPAKPPEKKDKKEDAPEIEPPDEKAEEKTPAEPEAKPEKAKELRVAYEKSKETIKGKDAEIAKLQTELKTAKSAPVDDPEKKSLLEKYESEVKRRTELEKEIAFVAYHKSTEFVDKYQKPYEEAWGKAVSELAELTIESEDGQTRTATAQDLLTLSNMPLGEARKLANQMFGDAADDVMAHRRKVRELSDAQTKALAEAQKNSETRDKERQTQSLQQRQKMATLWTDENKAWQERFPRWFKPEDGDEQGNSLLAKGYEMADAAFSGNGQKSPEEMVKLHAELRNKAAAFPKLALRLKQARSRIKELEKSLEDYEESEPPSGDGGKPRSIKPSDPEAEAMAELAAMK